MPGSPVSEANPVQPMVGSFAQTIRYCPSPHSRECPAVRQGLLTKCRVGPAGLSFATKPLELCGGLLGNGRVRPSPLARTGVRPDE